MKKVKRLWAGVLAFLLMLSFLGILSGCGGNKENVITSIDQIKNEKIKVGVASGSLWEQDAVKAFPNAEFVFFDSISEACLALSSGVTDAYVYGRNHLEFTLASNSVADLVILDGSIGSTDIAAGVSKKQSGLVEKINVFLKQIKADGTFDDMYDRWVVRAEDTMPDIPKAENPDTFIRFGTSGLVVPMNYVGEGGQITGLDVELMRRLALYLNADYSIDIMAFDALRASLRSDRLDVVISDLNVIEEQREIYDFSDPYMKTETAILVRKPSQEQLITEASQLDGKMIACPLGSSYTTAIEKKFPHATVIELATYAEMLVALKNGRIDACIVDEPTAPLQVAETGGICIIDELLTTDRFGFVVNKNNPGLRDEMNAVFLRLREEGKFDELTEKWIGLGKDHIFVPPEGRNTERGTLKVGLPLDSSPFSYMIDGELSGYDVELMYLVAAELGFDIEFIVCDFTALLAGVISERLDVAIGAITYTPEREETILFTESTYDTGTVALVRNGEEESGFIANLRDSFDRTFVREGRWKLIVSGLAVTVELSLLTLVGGSLLGLFFSFPLRSKRKFVRRTASCISTILDGLPILIILMVLYYIVFAKTTLSAIFIGVIGLSVDFANAVAGIMNAAVSTVSKGEIEAARSMGYSNFKIFMKIVFPQAISHMFSQYTGAVIAMIKGTSIIGYITVIDLTKAGDIIRGRTYEAFFPLIAIALIYFILARVFVAILKSLATRINPKHRKRVIKGVQSHD